MELRPYQQEAKDAIFEQWDSGVLKTLLVLPTGCGKTVVFAKVTEDCVRQGSRVLILAHRGELLDQAADKLKKTTGLGCAVEKAESSCQGTWFRVVVGSVQTLMREKRLNSFPSDYFDTIIIDEAHHCISDSYQRVLQHFSGAHVLGVTATPDRGDMKNLGTYFESLAYEYTLPKAIKEGSAELLTVYTPSSPDVQIIRCSLYDSSGVQLLDTQTVSIISDAAGLAQDIAAVDQKAQEAKEAIQTTSQEVTEIKSGMEGFETKLSKTTTDLQGVADGTLLYNTKCQDNGDGTTTVSAALYKYGYGQYRVIFPSTSILRLPMLLFATKTPTYAPIEDSNVYSLGN